MAARRGVILLLAMMPALTGGCLLAPRERPSLVKTLRPAAPAGANVITLDLAIIERPLGDRFFNKELWENTDEMLIQPQRRDALQANGFRAGQIVGLTPSGLQTLLKSERYCVNPRRRVVEPGKSITHMLGPVFPQATFTLIDEERKTPVTLDSARFCLDIIPTLTKDKQIHLEFVPKAETGERILPFQPDLDRATWTVRVDKPCREFRTLAWDLTVDSNKLVVIGTLPDRPDTLGFRAFSEDESRPVQRLLVIRASHSAAAEESRPELEEVLPSGSPLPLALQAASTGK